LGMYAATKGTTGEHVITPKAETRIKALLSV
jgi:hypothetical protein